MHDIQSTHLASSLMSAWWRPSSVTCSTSPSGSSRRLELLPNELTEREEDSALGRLGAWTGRELRFGCEAVGVRMGVCMVSGRVPL